MNSTYTYIANLSEQIPEIPEDSIVSRTVFSDDQTKTILFAFATGQELSEHTSTQIATLYFVQGEADITLGSDSMAAKPGTWAHMPPNLPHSIMAKTPVLMLLTMHKPAQE
jgi:quercetin dioxygenase-like cupin family protein